MSPRIRGTLHTVTMRFLTVSTIINEINKYRYNSLYTYNILSPIYFSSICLVACRCPTCLVLLQTNSANSWFITQTWVDLVGFLGFQLAKHIPSKVKSFVWKPWWLFFRLKSSRCRNFGNEIMEKTPFKPNISWFQHVSTTGFPYGPYMIISWMACHGHPSMVPCLALLTCADGRVVDHHVRLQQQILGRSHPSPNPNSMKKHTHTLTHTHTLFLYSLTIKCIYLSIYLPTYLSIYLSIYLSLCLSIYLSIHPSIHPSIYLYP